MDPMPHLDFFHRLWWSFVCFFRTLADGHFAARTWAVRDVGEAALPQETAAVPPDPSSAPRPSPPREERSETKAPVASALMLLGLLQREGRLVDFLQQDVEAFDDAEIGAAARVVHAGCRKALARHATIEPVRPEDEDSVVAVADGFDSGAIKLTGRVGEPPYRGTLRHRGWRAELRLPEPVGGHDVTVVAPAEVEVSSP